MHVNESIVLQMKFHVNLDNALDWTKMFHAWIKINRENQPHTNDVNDQHWHSIDAILTLTPYTMLMITYIVGIFDRFSDKWNENKTTNKQHRFWLNIFYHESFYFRLPINLHTVFLFWLSQNWCLLWDGANLESNNKSQHRNMLFFLRNFRCNLCRIIRTSHAFTHYGKLYNVSEYWLRTLKVR